MCKLFRKLYLTSKSSQNLRHLVCIHFLSGSMSTASEFTNLKYLYNHYLLLLLVLSNARPGLNKTKTDPARRMRTWKRNKQYLITFRFLFSPWAWFCASRPGLGITHIVLVLVLHVSSIAARVSQQVWQLPIASYQTIILYYSLIQILEQVSTFGVRIDNRTYRICCSRFRLAVRSSLSVS